MKILISAISNWNVDPIIRSLIDDGHEVNLYCLRGPYKIPFNNIGICRPFISFVFQCLYIIFLKYKFINGDIYSSKLFAFITYLYDLEVSYRIRFNNQFDVIIAWASGSKLTFQASKKLGKCSLLFNGNSHIKQQQEVQYKYGNKIIRDFFIKQQLSEYQLADKILVESEYSKKTHVDRGVLNKRIEVLNIPVISLGFNQHNKLNDIAFKDPIKNVLNICFVSPRKIKGLDIFLNLVEIANSRNDFPVIFTIFGTLQDATDKKRFENYENVRHKENTLQAAFLESLAEMDIIIIPTYEDGGPRVLTEAALLGVHAVGSKYSKLPELEICGIAKVINTNAPSDYYDYINFFYKSVHWDKINSIKIAETLFNSHLLSKKIIKIADNVKNYANKI